MAIELADAYVSINPSTRGLKANLSRELSGPLAEEGDRAGRSASSRFGGAFVAGMAGIARRAGIALAAGGALAGGFGIKVAADFQQTTIAFEGILGSAEEAQRVLGNLREFASKTPFELTGLADSAKNLLAVGYAADDIIPTMTILGNVAATLGVGEAEIAGVVRALGQMKGKGKASAEELQQISEQIPGFSAVQAIADGMGVSVAKAFEWMAKGAVPADAAIEHILAGMEKFPGAAGAMERQSKTLNGVISTFKDTLATTAIDFITPYLPAMSRAIETFSSGLQDFIYFLTTPFDESPRNNMEKFGQVAREAFGRIADIAQALGRAIAQVLPTIRGLVSDGLNAISEWWSRNGDNVAGFFRDVGDIFQNIIRPAFEAVGDFIWRTLLPALKGIAEWVVTNQPALVGVAAFIGTVLVASFLAWAASATAAAIATIVAAAPLLAIAAVIALVAAGLIYFASKWDDAGSNVWKFRYALGEVMDFVGPVIAGIVVIVDTLVDALGRAVDLMRTAIDLGRQIPALIPDVTPGFDVPFVPFLDHGGIMPGPRGVHSLAYVAGGETVLPTHRSDFQLSGGGDTYNIFNPIAEDPEQSLLRVSRRKMALAGSG